MNRNFLPGASHCLGLAVAALALLLLSPSASAQETEKAHAPEAAQAGAPGEAAGEHATGGGEHAAEKSNGQIVAQLFWSIASFLIVLGVLTKKLFPVILASLDKRAGDIREALAAAEKARGEAQELMARHEAQLEKARKEAQAIVTEGKADAVKLKDSILAGAKKDSEEMVARARREIEQAKVTAIDDLTRRSVQLSLELSSRLIRKNLNADEQQGLIQETIRGLPAA